MKKKKEEFVAVELDLPTHDMLSLMMQAHDADMTFNDWVNMKLREHIKDLESKKKKGTK
jgi:hypothetical protein